MNGQLKLDNSMGLHRLALPENAPSSEVAPLTGIEVERAPNGRLVRYAGIVTVRQQPETANGTTFISLEDKTGIVQ